MKLLQIITSGEQSKCEYRGKTKKKANDFLAMMFQK